MHAYPTYPIALRNPRPRSTVSLAAGASRVGERGSDEDDLLMVAGLGLYAVADGVGGVPGGALASATALSAVAASLSEGRDVRLEERALRSVIAARHAIWERRHVESAMATTLAMVLMEERFAVVAHLGDSRVYRFRDDELLQLTYDHSVAADAARAGIRLPARFHHVLSRVLSARTADAPTLRRVQLEPQDRFLICTDGVSNTLPEAELAAALRERTPQRAVAKLIEGVTRLRAFDDATAVVVDVPPRFADRTGR